MSARSMTGFARARRTSDFGEIVTTVKSVNHRGFDMHTYLPVTLEPYEGSVRALVKKYVSRGHLDVRVSCVKTKGNGLRSLNRELFAGYLAALEEARRDFGIESVPDLHAALQIPGMLSPGDPGEESNGAESALLMCLEEALAEMNRFREREGSAIALVMVEYGNAIHVAAEEMSELRSKVLPALRGRLQDRLTELLAGANLDPQRLAQEAAMLAERSDIAEEVARLKVHSRELVQLLNNGGEMGKKLDFLLQEMNRESNTVLSKTNGVGEIGLRLTELGLTCKANIEKIREQALNLE